MFEITKTTMISEILENAPQAMPAFQSIGMHCMAAPSPAARRLSRPATPTRWTRPVPRGPQGVPRNVLKGEKPAEAGFF